MNHKDVIIDGKKQNQIAYLADSFGIIERHAAGLLNHNSDIGFWMLYKCVQDHIRSEYHWEADGLIHPNEPLPRSTRRTLE